MVHSLSHSCPLPPLTANESSDNIIGGALVSVSDSQSTGAEYTLLSFIYRYNSTTLEVRDILQTKSVYASLSTLDLPAQDAHQLAIEYAVHGAIGDTLYIFLVARNTRSLFPELFVFDPWRLQCNRIASFAGSKDRVTSLCVSPQIPDQHNLMTDTSIESNRFYQLLVIGTDGGSVHILRLCPDIFLREPDVPSAIVACKTQYVASLSIHVENTSISNGSTSDSAYIFVGGFNGEIEIITYGRLLDENEPKYGVQSTKVVTTLWKKMAVTTMAIRSLQGKSEAVLMAGQSYSGISCSGSEEHKPSITILKLKLPSMKSMAVWKEECADLTSETGEGRHYESARILSFNIFESKTDDKLKFCSTWAVQRIDGQHSVMFGEWSIPGNADSALLVRQLSIAYILNVIDAVTVGCFGKVIVLGASQLQAAYTTVVEPSRIEISETKSSLDFGDIVKKVRTKLSQYGKKAASAYADRRKANGEPLIIDRFLEQDGFEDQYPPPKHIYERYCDMLSAHGDAAAIRSSCALLYIVLDTLGDSGFQMFAEHIHLDIATNRLIEDCWAVDHLRIDKLNASKTPTYTIPFPNNYIRAVKDQAGTSAALKLIETNHIAIEDVADYEVLSAYLLTLNPVDAVMALRTIGITLTKASKLENVHRKLVSHWFEDENSSRMATQLIRAPLDGMLEQEVITYCSTTEPSSTNLNFLFSYYLNRNHYAAAMAVHEALKKQDESGLVRQQRKVITDSVSNLVPPIQKTLSAIPVDKIATVEAIPFSSLVFSQSRQPSGPQHDETIIEKLLQQVQLVNPSNPHSNAFARPPKMAI